MTAIASRATSLPTGSRFRSDSISNTVSNCFAICFMCAAATRNGRLAATDTRVNSRAAQNLSLSVPLSRALFNDLGLESSFNGVSSSTPEIGLMMLAESGPTPPLLTLKLADSVRRDFASQIAFGLGVTSGANRQILQAQAESSTAVVGLGFASEASRVASLDPDTFTSNEKWCTWLTTCVLLAVSPKPQTPNPTPLTKPYTPKPLNP